MASYYMRVQVGLETMILKRKCILHDSLRFNSLVICNYSRDDNKCVERCGGFLKQLSFVLSVNPGFVTEYITIYTGASLPFSLSKSKGCHATKKTRR